jgi:RNA polymerase sigma-32 factor
MASAHDDESSELGEEALTDLDGAGSDEPSEPAQAEAGNGGAPPPAVELGELQRPGLAKVRDPVERFLAEARRYPRLTEAEERALGSAVREHGDMDAARRLVVHNLRLVIAIAYQYRRAWTNILDLFQEGSVGLMEAVKRWEPKLGPRFGTYAAYWIRAYVLRFLMTNSRLIHVGNTRAGRKLYYRLEKERQKLLAAGIDVTPKLLAAKLDVDEKELDEVRQHLESREIPFDPRASSDSGSEESYPLTERLAAPESSPETEAAHAELNQAVQKFVAGFRSQLTDERERAVWAEHLAADDPVSLGELGARFGVSKQRMGQIADQLKKRFRARIVDELGPDIRTDWLGAEE